MSKVELSDEDRKHLVELFKKAEATPGMAPLSFRHAWGEVRKEIDRLGEKYGFDPTKVKVDAKTGEVFFIEGEKK